MSNKNQNSFLDPKTLLAVVLVAGLWFGWQSYLTKKYPTQTPAVATATSGTATDAAATPGGNSATALSANTVAGAGGSAAAGAVAPMEEKKLAVTNAESSFEISSQGMGIKGLKLNQYTRRDKSSIEFGKGLDRGLYELHLLDDPRPINFHVETTAENTFVGTAQIGNMKIVRTIVYTPATFSFQNKISVTNADMNFKGLSLIIPEKKDTNTSGGFFANYDHQEFLVSHDNNKLDTTNVSSSKDNIDKTQGQVFILSVAAQYFASAVMDKSEIAPEAHMISKSADPFFEGVLSYKVASVKDKMDFNFLAYSGPKSHEILEKADPLMGNIIDLGFFGAIGKILLVILKWFNGFLGNWGFSIIALTLLVRLLVMPFNVASYKSMKKMQKIQPLMAAVRERYKDDPQAQQRETMALMKSEKVNPLGGCLPMLLQMPIFFALFRTLGQSIDLYQAPFIWWIHDLSLKDPFYVLPALMGITLFIQQKITPSTMDPQQAKVMQFMPILFTFFMISLPSGLTLYTFVSTLFGILQQRFFMRDRLAIVNAREAKA